MIKLVILYLLIVGSIGGILYGIPALREFPKVHKWKFTFAIGLGFVLMIFIYIGEQIQ